jgi:phospholipase A1
LEPYKDTYILPYAYDTIGSPDRMAEEFKFQISIRKEVFRCAPLHVYIGYTQLSLWQFYQPSNSRAFRTSDYNPEFFFVLNGRPVSPLPGELRFGLEHQSNGAGGIKERSWNRIYVQPSLGSVDGLSDVALKLWWRIPEGKKVSPSNPGGDDNPDIEDFLGFFELRPTWTFGPYHKLSGMYRRGYRDGTDTVQLDYDVTIGFPGSGVMARIQVFSGYGETLMDYNRRVNRIGIGFLFQ